jgi:hypothetical protein
MTDQSISQQAEHLSRRRARALPVLAIIFISQQFAFFSDRPGAARTVDQVHIGAWLVLSVVILLALTTGGGWIYSKEVRDLANDEVTRSHRDSGFRFGFLAAMMGCVALYLVDLYEPMAGRDAIHLIMTIGVAAALLRFGYLERRALHDA